MTITPTRRRFAGLAALSIGATLLVAPAGATASTNAADAPDLVIVSDARALRADEIRDHDISATAAGRGFLARTAADVGLSHRPSRVFRFGEQTVAVDVTTPLAVTVGRNAAGDVVYDVVPTALQVDAPTLSGYVVPPSSAWKYNTDGSGTASVGTWKRDWWWTMTKANDYKSCSTCTAYDYWRIHGKMRAATLTGSSSNEGFKRAWMEFKKKSGWSTPTTFESDRPEESYAGAANTTTTIGFGSTFGVNIGAPPLTVSGGTSSTYGGSVTKSSENWHPVIRSGVGDGGVQWCRYESAEFTGTKTIATRVGARISSNGTNAGWSILMGMQDYTSSCPSQI